MFLYSEKLDALAKALSTAQSQFKTIKKTGVNPHFNSHFATYNDLKDGTDEALAANGLSVSHYPISEAGDVGVVTVLLHSSGQFILSRLMMKPSRPGPQEAGSIITYFKRYGRACVLGIEGELDDDGNSESIPKEKSQEVRYDYKLPPPIIVPDGGIVAQEGLQKTGGYPNWPQPTRAQKPEYKANPAKAGEPISEAQGKSLFALSKSAGWDINEVRDYISLAFGYTSTKEISRGDYETICTTIQNESPQAVMAKFGKQRPNEPSFTDEFPDGDGLPF
jgi:hypothetical protein